MVAIAAPIIEPGVCMIHRRRGQFLPRQELHLVQAWDVSIEYHLPSGLAAAGDEQLRLGSPFWRLHKVGPVQDNRPPAGDERGEEPLRGKARTMSISDWVVLGSYILIVTTLGGLFYRRRTSTSEYFLGSRSMSAVPVAISLVAADLSAITYMGVPAWCYSRNMELFLTTCAYLLAAPVVMRLFMPFYSRFNFYTGYEYLERRFDLKTRLLGSAIFLLTRGAHVAIVIYVPSLALSVITGLPVYVCVLIMGVFTTFYTTLGGMKAVIWTDVLQFSVLVLGMVAIFGLSVARIPGGVLGAFQVAKQAGRLQLLNFSLNPRELTSVWATLFGGGTMVLSTFATDQAYLQRYFTTKSLREGQRSILMDALISIPVVLVLYLLGAVLYAFYHFHPARLQGLPHLDAILPFFVVHELGGLFSGLIIASIFASSMAVMSAGINALTTVTTVDIYRRLLQPAGDESHYVVVGRLGTLGWGAVATAAALFVGRLGPIATAFNIISSFLGGPILGIFLLGMLFRRVNGTGAVAGGGVGLVAVSLLARCSQVSFFYYAPVGTLVTMAFGYLISLFRPARSASELAGLVRSLETPTTR